MIQESRAILIISKSWQRIHVLSSQEMLTVAHVRVAKNFTSIALYGSTGYSLNRKPHRSASNAHSKD